MVLQQCACCICYPGHAMAVPCGLAVLLALALLPWARSRDEATCMASNDGQPQCWSQRKCAATACSFWTPKWPWLKILQNWTGVNFEFIGIFASILLTFFSSIVVRVSVIATGHSFFPGWPELHMGHASLSQVHCAMSLATCSSLTTKVVHMGATCIFFLRLRTQCAETFSMVFHGLQFLKWG